MPTNSKKHTVKMASNDELLNPVYYNRLWLAMNAKEISRRKWMDEISKAIFNFDGDIILADGRHWPVCEVDRILNDRTIGNFLQALDGKPRRKARYIEPLRLYDLYFRIKHPLIARHFGR